MDWGILHATGKSSIAHWHLQFSGSNSRSTKFVDLLHATSHLLFLFYLWNPQAFSTKDKEGLDARITISKDCQLDCALPPVNVWLCPTVLECFCSRLIVSLTLIDGEYGRGVWSAFAIVNKLDLPSGPSVVSDTVTRRISRWNLWILSSWSIGCCWAMFVAQQYKITSKPKSFYICQNRIYQ